jgi:hypothetical protein
LRSLPLRVSRYRQVVLEGVIDPDRPWFSSLLLYRNFSARIKPSFSAGEHKSIVLPDHSWVRLAVLREGGGTCLLRPPIYDLSTSISYLCLLPIMLELLAGTFSAENNICALVFRLPIWRIHHTVQVKLSL